MVRCSALVFAAALTVAAVPAAPPTYRLVSTIAGPDGGWDLTSVDPLAHRLYVARSEAIMAVDLATGKVTPTLVAAERGHAALVLPGTHDVLTTNGATNTALLIDGLTGTIRASIPTGTKPDAAAYDGVTRTVWIMNPGSGDITLVDARSAKVLTTVAVPGSLELGVVDGAGHLFVNVEDKNDVAVIDTRTRRLVNRFPLSGCDGPTGITYVPDSKLLISACANGVAIVSRPDGKQVASLPIGPGADGALYDEQRRVALIPSGGDGTLSVISLTPRPRVIDRIATAKGARTAALDPSTGRVYLSAADYLPAVGKERPKMVAGSYRVLVLEPTR